MGRKLINVSVAAYLGRMGDYLKEKPVGVDHVIVFMTGQVIHNPEFLPLLSSMIEKGEEPDLAGIILQMIGYAMVGDHLDNPEMSAPDWMLDLWKAAEQSGDDFLQFSADAMLETAGWEEDLRKLLPEEDEEGRVD